jgi:hypothetical protein
MKTYFNMNELDGVRQAVQLLPDEVFWCWSPQPHFIIDEEDGGEDEFALVLLSFDSVDTIFIRNEAFNLAMAFISGYFADKGE